MIRSIIVTNYLNESIELELRAPEKSGLAIQDVSGLGPAGANINSTELSTADGSIYNSARLNSRNIVLTMILLDKPTIGETRLLLYKYFPIKKKIKLQITTDNRTCYTYGYVETNEPVIFSNACTAQISIMCPDPYFYADEVNTTILSGIEPLFEFPMDINPDVVLGEIISTRTQNIYYTGDAEIGVSIFLHSVGVVTNLSVYNLTTREVMTIDDAKLTTLTGSGIVAGDDIVITTIKGQKSITLFRSGVYINIINCLGLNTNWFQLAKGDNIFAYNAVAGRENIYCRLENLKLYEGV